MSKYQNLLTLTSGVGTVGSALLFLSPQVQAQSKEASQSQMDRSIAGPSFSRAKAEIARLQADAKRAREDLPVCLSNRKALTGSRRGAKNPEHLHENNAAEGDTDESKPSG